MNLLTAADQEKIVNLAMVQSIELNHYSASSLITFNFGGNQHVNWRFANPERADEVYESICNTASFLF